MVSDSSSVRFLDPAGEPSAPVVPYTARLEPAAKPLRLALASNSFPDATIFLQDMATALRPHFGAVEATLYEKGKSSVSIPMSGEILEQMAENDVILAGVGHCGSCTSSILRTARATAAHGKPVVVLVTEEFVDEVAFVLRAVGMPSLPVVIVPHPIAGRDQDTHRKIAEAIAPLVKHAWLTGESCLEAPALDQRAAA